MSSSPWSAGTFSVLRVSVSVARRVLLIEGGGMKATYVHGILTAFERAGYQPWDAVYGNSAGGALAAWYAAGQAEFAEGTWRYARDRRFLSYRRSLLRRGPLLDHEALIDIVYQTEHPLDVQAVRRAPFEVRVVVADARTGETLYPDIRHDDVLRLIKATGRLPFGSNGPVPWRERLLLDGGCTDPIPLRHIFDEGATEVTMLLNQPPGEAQRDARWLVERAVRRYPALADGLRQHVERKAQAWLLAHDPPAGCTVRLIHPAQHTGLHRLSRDHDALRRAMALGREDGRWWLDTHARRDELRPRRRVARVRPM